MKFRRPGGQEVGVNLTPLIDVVFLLLIFFMVSTSFTRETRLSIDLPEARGEIEPEAVKRLEILVDAAGRYAVAGRALPDAGLESLQAAISQAAAGDTARPLAITADARAPHEAVVRVMDAAGRAGFSRLGITTLSPNPPPAPQSAPQSGSQSNLPPAQQPPSQPSPQSAPQSSPPPVPQSNLQPIPPLTPQPAQQPSP